MSSCTPFQNSSVSTLSLSLVDDDDTVDLTWLGVALGAIGSLGIAVGEMGFGGLETLLEKRRCGPDAATVTTVTLHGASGGAEVSSTTHNPRAPGRWRAARNLLVYNFSACCRSSDWDEETWIQVRMVNYRLLVGVSALANFVAFSFAPTTVLAPLEGLQFVAAFAWALYYKKPTLWPYYCPGQSGSERASTKTGTFRCCPTRRCPRPKDTLKAFLGVLCVLGAVVVIVQITPPSGPKFGIKGLQCLWTRPTWVVLATTLAGTAALLYLYSYCTDVKTKPHQKLPGQRADCRTDEKRDRDASTGELLRQAFPAATVGAFAATAAKQISELLRVWLEEGDWDAFSFDAPTYGLFWSTSAIAAAGFWLWMQALHFHMATKEETLVLPVFQGTYIVLASTAGGVFFDDFALYATWQLVAFWLLLALLVAGVALMMNKPPPDTCDNQTVPTSAAPRRMEVSLPLLLVRERGANEPESEPEP
jgi:hypothetical protein